MSQSRRHSFIESLTNIAVGAGMSLALQFLIFPRLGIHVSDGINILITAIFTVSSFARSYILRRVFDAWTRLRGIRASGAVFGERF